MYQSDVGKHLNDKEIVIKVSMGKPEESNYSHYEPQIELKHHQKKIGSKVITIVSQSSLNNLTLILTLTYNYILLVCNTLQ